MIVDKSTVSLGCGRSQDTVERLQPFHTIELIGDIHAVRDQHQRHVVFTTSLTNQVDHGLATGRIDVRGRFIRQQQFGASRQAASNRYSLLLTDRQLSGAVMSAIGQTDSGQQRFGSRYIMPTTSK